MGNRKEFELKLEIGHKSIPLKQKLANGYTHKWTAYVKGVNDSKIHYCIQRVIFELHESFENPKRVLNEPPYQVKETGYAGFEIPIHIHFKNKDKPNSFLRIHDLALLTNKPNESCRVETFKFVNPAKDFEKCLIKSGARLLSPTVRRDRSDSPPAKKQKSTSIIPSKDMSKQSHNHSSSHKHHHHHSSSSSSGHHNNHHNNAQPPPQSQQQPQQSSHNSSSVQKPKSSSKEFVDIFGAPLVYNHQNHDLQTIQTKIHCLNDPNRLQKIVDIIEQAGEWFNLTSKKFEFDLKRLDKKTLSKIERCLQD